MHLLIYRLFLPSLENLIACLLFNIQVFVTTHSWDCVSAYVETLQKNETEGLLFHLGRSALTSDHHKIIATAYDKEELELVTRTDLEVR